MSACRCDSLPAFYFFAAVFAIGISAVAFLFAGGFFLTAYLCILVGAFYDRRLFWKDVESLFERSGVIALQLSCCSRLAGFPVVFVGDGIMISPIEFFTVTAGVFSSPS